MPDSPTQTVTVRAVLFDMDGTLVDSTEVVESMWAAFAERFGVDLTALLAYSHGRQTRDTVARFLPPGPDPDRVVADFERAELVRVDGVREIPGAAWLLASLASAPVAVVTSASRELAEVRLRAAGLAVPDVLVPADEITRGKPDPQGYLLAADRLGVSPADCVVLEDAAAGIEAGVAAGGHTLVVGAHRSAITRGLPRVPDLNAVGATVTDDGAIRLSWPATE